MNLQIFMKKDLFLQATASRVFDVRKDALYFLEVFNFSITGSGAAFGLLAS